MAFKLDIIVPQWNQVGYTLALFKSIKKTAPDGTRVILVDNGSERDEFEAAVAALGDYPRLVVRNSENLGFVRGTNEGICASSAEYLCFQNTDTEMFPGGYERILYAFQGRLDIGAVGPLASVCESWQSIANVAKTYPEINGALAWKDHDKIAYWLASNLAGQRREVGSMIAFFCSVFPRRVIEQVGLLSTEYGMGFGDDDDYCERIRRAGFKILLALDAYVYHAHRASFKKLYTPEQLEEAKRKNLEIFKEKWKAAPLPTSQRGGMNEIRRKRVL